jgi:hypothetical protein
MTAILLLADLPLRTDYNTRIRAALAQAGVKWTEAPSRVSRGIFIMVPKEQAKVAYDAVRAVPYGKDYYSQKN